MSRSRDMANIGNYANSVASAAARSADIKPGTTAFFAMQFAPAGWIKANGANISRTVYSDLYSAIGTYYGTGDGSTTFTLPDLRGEFMRAWDDNRGADSGRTFGTAQTNSTKLLMNGSSTGNSPEGNSSTGIITHKPGVEMIGIEATFWGQYGNRVTLRGAMDSTWGGASETRPRNIALLACIKY